jgi:hypothetical protein
MTPMSHGEIAHIGYYRRQAIGCTDKEMNGLENITKNSTRVKGKECLK